MSEINLTFGCTGYSHEKIMRKNEAVSINEYVVKVKNVYYIVGCNLFGIGNYSVQKIFSEAKKFFASLIDEDNYKDKNDIAIEVEGFSRGGITSTKFVRMLRLCREKAKNNQTSTDDSENKIINWMKSKHIKINYRVADAYYGPTAKGDDTETDVGQKGSDNSDVVVLATNTLFNCTPMMIKNCDHVVIRKGGHDNTLGILHWDFAKFNNKVILVEEKANNDGEVAWIGITATKNDILELYNAIKDIYRPRRNVIMILVCMKLNIKPDSLIEWIPDYKKEFVNVLKNVKNAWTLNGAFEYAFQLFDDKDKGLFYSLIHKQEMKKGQDNNQKKIGKFYKELTLARQFCKDAGLTNSKQSKLTDAIAILYNVILRGKEERKSYKMALSSALILKIYSKLNGNNKKFVDSIELKNEKILEICKNYFSLYA